MGAPDSIIPASPEVIEHAIRQHEHVRTWPIMPRCDLICRCGSTVLVPCGDCAATLYLAIRPDRPPCRHAREAWSTSLRSAAMELLTGRDGEGAEHG